jgi:hypothetical protein
VSQWISINDDLPPVGQPVWIYMKSINPRPTKDDYIHFAVRTTQGAGPQLAECHDDAFWTGEAWEVVMQLEGEEGIEPSHWMPLPLPPKGGAA